MHIFHLPILRHLRCLTALLILFYVLVFIIVVSKKNLRLCENYIRFKNYFKLKHTRRKRGTYLSRKRTDIVDLKIYLINRIVNFRKQIYILLNQARSQPQWQSTPNRINSMQKLLERTNFSEVFKTLLRCCALFVTSNIEFFNSRI